MSLLVLQPGLHSISGIACTWAWGRCCVPVLSRWCQIECQLQMLLIGFRSFPTCTCNGAMRPGPRHLSPPSTRSWSVGQTDLRFPTVTGARGTSRWPSSSLSCFGWTTTMFQTAACSPYAAKPCLSCVKHWRNCTGKAFGWIRTLPAALVRKAWNSWNFTESWYALRIVMGKPYGPSCPNHTWCTIFLWNARKHVVQWFHRLRMRFRLVKISLERSLALREGWDRSRWFSVCLNALWWSRASVGLKPISWAAESKKRWSIAGSTGMGNADGMHHNFKRLNKY